MFIGFPAFGFHSPWLPRLAWIHECLQPAKVAWHFLEDVAISAVCPLRLADHPSQEDHIPVHGQHGAAGGHGAVGIGPGNGAAHFIGDQVGVHLQALLQLVVWQMIKGERTLESRSLCGILPASDDGRQWQLQENVLCEISFRQTGSDHIFLKNDVVTEFNHSQVIVRATLCKAWVDMHCFYIQCLLSSFGVDAALACGGAQQDLQDDVDSQAQVHIQTCRAAVISLKQSDK